MSTTTSSLVVWARDRKRGARLPVEQIVHLVHDLPAGGRRLMRKAVGYRMTIKSGVVTFEDGESTGDQPGGLPRGNRPAPA